MYFLKRDIHKLLQYLATLNDDAGVLKAATVERIEAVRESTKISRALENWHNGDSRYLNVVIRAFRETMCSMDARRYYPAYFEGERV
ncbi:hypothetical protein OH76DRAFT_1025563 [Lentinus brumalis]|uniref:Uncharacterized protein n=1 Tax=Lentinus brumalis TaxID=2498619 RepID=A0A371CXK4_9APHY|nr:hypothetical protein OH76DRAFT_1025563 [Polyporus brumalis]